MNNRLNLSRLAGAPPPHSLNVDLKVSEMSAFRPPQGCASGSLWDNIINKLIIFAHSDPEAQPRGGPKADISETFRSTVRGGGGRAPTTHPQFHRSVFGAYNPI